MRLLNLKKTYKYRCPCCGKTEGNYGYDMSNEYFCAINWAAETQKIDKQYLLLRDDIFLGASNEQLSIGKIYGVNINGIRKFLDKMSVLLERNHKLEGADRVKYLKDNLNSKGLKDIRIELPTESDVNGAFFQVSNKDERYEILKTKRCPNCHSPVAQIAGKYPQILVSVIGSERANIKGFIVAAISSIENYYKEKIEIEQVSEIGAVQGDYTKDSTESGLKEEDVIWYYEYMKKKYDEYLENKSIKYPRFESTDPYDNEAIHSYSFKVKNKDTGKIALLTIVEYNAFCVDQWREEKPHRLESIMKGSDYILFMLAETDNTIDVIHEYTDMLRDKAAFALICIKENDNELEVVNNFNPRIETNWIRERLKRNKDYISKIFSMNDVVVFNEKKGGYFVCCPYSRRVNGETERIINCEDPLLWIFALEGILPIWMHFSHHNGDVYLNRESSNWNSIKKRLML